MITDSDRDHLRQKLHDKLKDTPRSVFAHQNGIRLSKLSQFLNGHAVSEPTIRKLQRAVADPAVQPELFDQPSGLVLATPQLTKEEKVRMIQSLDVDLVLKFFPTI